MEMCQTGRQHKFKTGSATFLKLQHLTACLAGTTWVKYQRNCLSNICDTLIIIQMSRTIFYWFEGKLVICSTHWADSALSNQTILLVPSLYWMSHSKKKPGLCVSAAKMTKGMKHCPIFEQKRVLRDSVGVLRGKHLRIRFLHPCITIIRFIIERTWVEIVLNIFGCPGLVVNGARNCFVRVCCTRVFI